jgi:hypothetical protein
MAWGFLLPHRHDANRAPSTPGHDASEPPEPGDLLAATDAACACEQVPPLPRAVGFPRLLMEHAHPGDEGLIGCAHEDSLADAARARSPSAHLSHSTHGPPAKRPGLRLHEALWHRDSWAKDIAAFVTMSCSSVTRARSRFRRATST